MSQDENDQLEMSKSIASGVEKSKENLKIRLDEIEKEVETTEQNVTISNDTLKQINDLLSQAFMQGRRKNQRGNTKPEPNDNDHEKIFKEANNYVTIKGDLKNKMEESKNKVKAILEEIGQIDINVEGKFEHQNRIRDAIKDIQTNTQQQIMVLLCKMEDRAAGRQTKWEACMGCCNTQG